MELDEMKQAWHLLSDRLDRQQDLQWQIFRDSRTDRMRRGLRPLWWGQALQLGFGVVIAVWGISFWTGHRGIWQAMACGIVMQVFGTLAVISTGRVLGLLQAIDYAAPVLDIQRRLAHLRQWRTRVEAPVFAVLGSVIWIPALLMWAQYAMDRAGLNLWQQMGQGSLWLLLVGAMSLALVGVVVLLLRWLGLGAWLGNRIAGRSVQRSESLLAELERFEHQ